MIKRLNEQFTMKACHLEPQHAYVSGQGMCLTSKIAKRRKQIHDRVVDGNDNVILLSHREHILSRPRATWTGANFKQIPMTEKEKKDHRHVFSQFNELKNQHDHHIIASHFRNRMQISKF